MYGGTAKTYCEYTLLCEPFKDGKVYYVKVESPKTGRALKVRWYTDKAHNDLMPKRENPYGPLCTIFGFKDEQDTIFCIKKSQITSEEEADYFGWKRGWRFGMFFGGVWYATKDTELPPIKRQDKIIEVTWQQFRKAGQEHSKQLGLVAEKDSCWFREEE